MAVVDAGAAAVEGVGAAEVVEAGVVAEAAVEGMTVAEVVRPVAAGPVGVGSSVMTKL